MLRRTRLLLPAAVLVLPLAACSTGPADTAAAPDPSSAVGSPDTDAFPVTIEHAFGSTTIPEQPTRVATVSWVNADVALALGVVPVGMATDEYGGNSHGSTPWKDAALEELDAPIGSAKAPAQYSEADGVNFTAIARTSPDVILAAYSGLTRADYTKLSKIAPVVAYPDLAYGTSWQDSTELIGEALGREDQAEDLVDSTEDLIEDEAAKYPQIEGKTFIYGNLEPGSADGVNVYTASDNRPRFLSELGMEPAPVVARHAKKDAFFVPWSAERADELDSDVFVTWVPDEGTVRKIVRDPLLGQIPAVARGSFVADPDNTLTLSVSAASPLSLPWALDRFLPMLGAAADKA